MKIRIASPRTLKRNGVLGVNRRNGDFIQRLNRRTQYRLVDDKLTTKRLAKKANMTVPDLYGVVEREHEAESLVSALRRYGGFVIKPARGSGGKGITVIQERLQDRRGRCLYRTPSGKLLNEQDLLHSISNILGGLYSLGGTRDVAMIEQLVIPDPIFRSIAWQGVPDIRIVVVKGYPIMAMVRLPTSASRGCANLHQGALGVGVDLVSGELGSGTYFNRQVSEHPDTLCTFDGLRVPYWDDLLHQAAACYDWTDIGYLGVDLVLDEREGPILLELNARPGLSIQIANRSGLAQRLRKAEHWAASAPRADAGERAHRIRSGFSAG